MKGTSLLLVGFSVVSLASPSAHAQGPIVAVERTLMEFAIIARSARVVNPAIKGAGGIHGAERAVELSTTIKSASEISTLIGNDAIGFARHQQIMENLNRASLAESLSMPRTLEVPRVEPTPPLFRETAESAAKIDMAAPTFSRSLEQTVSPASASPKGDPVFHFSVLSGKLEVGSVAKFKYLDLKGGEVNIYRWGAAGAGAIYCETQECVSQLLKKVTEADELFHWKKPDTPSRHLPEKDDLPN